MSDWTPLLTGIVGSVAYDLDTPDSDIDTLSVAAAPTEEFHGLWAPTGRAATRAATGPDSVTHEVGKFVSLCLSCNPTANELLWLDAYEEWTPLGLELRQLRTKLLSARGVRNAYLGYATSQFKRLRDRGTSFSSETRSRTEKHARHLLRLVLSGAELYHTGHLTIRVEDRGRIMDFGRRVASDPVAGLDLAERTIAFHAAAMDSSISPLPYEPDRDAANQYLLRVRRHFFTET